MNSIKHLIVLGTIIFASTVSTSAQKPKVKIGIGVSHLYDLYEGPIALSSTSGNVTYTVTDIDLKGLNGVYTKFDVGFSSARRTVSRCSKEYTAILHPRHLDFTARQSICYL